MSKNQNSEIEVIRNLRQTVCFDGVRLVLPCPRRSIQDRKLQILDLKVADADASVTVSAT